MLLIQSNMSYYCAVGMGSKGEYDDARTLFQEVFDFRRSKFNERHADVLKVTVSLADAHEHLGNHEEAKALYEQALAGYVKNLGEDHVFTIRTRNRLQLLVLSSG